MISLVTYSVTSYYLVRDCTLVDQSNVTWLHLFGIYGPNRPPLGRPSLRAKNCPPQIRRPDY